VVYDLYFQSIIDTPRDENEAVLVIAERYFLNVTCPRRFTISQNEKCSMCSKFIFLWWTWG